LQLVDIAVFENAGCEGVTVPLLELVRFRLRDLVQHIEKSRKAIVYSDFTERSARASNMNYLADKNAIANTISHPTMTSEATAPAVSLSFSFMV
jgi:hypothetical protein